MKPLHPSHHRCSDAPESRLFPVMVPAHRVKVPQQTVERFVHPMKLWHETVEGFVQPVKLSRGTVKLSQQAVKLLTETVKGLTRTVELPRQTVKGFVQTVKLSSHPVKLLTRTVKGFVPPFRVGRVVLHAASKAEWASSTSVGQRRPRGLTRRLGDQPPYHQPPDHEPGRAHARRYRAALASRRSVFLPVSVRFILRSQATENGSMCARLPVFHLPHQPNAQKPHASPALLG